MFKGFARNLLLISTINLYLAQNFVLSTNNEERLSTKLKSLNPTELSIIMDTLTREFEYEVEMLSNHDYYMILKNSIGRMNRTQKFYLMAFITSLTYNLKELNTIFDEILFDSDLVNNNLENDQPYLE